MISLSARRWPATLIEFVPVIVIVCALIAIILPAMQQVRESNRRTQAMNNLKQIGPVVSLSDEAKRRWGSELKAEDPVLCWTCGYSNGGVIPIRLFLGPLRVLSDNYGVFVYDPDAGYARGFEPASSFRFHGWRNGVMVMEDAGDGTLYSCL